MAFFLTKLFIALNLLVWLSIGLPPHCQAQAIQVQVVESCCQPIADACHMTCCQKSKGPGHMGQAVLPNVARTIQVSNQSAPYRGAGFVSVVEPLELAYQPVAATVAAAPAPIKIYLLKRSLLI